MSARSASRILAFLLVRGDLLLRQRLHQGAFELGKLIVRTLLARAVLRMLEPHAPRAESSHRGRLLGGGEQLSFELGKRLVGIGARPARDFVALWVPERCRRPVHVAGRCGLVPDRDGPGRVCRGPARGLKRPGQFLERLRRSSERRSPDRPACLPPAGDPKKTHICRWQNS